SARQRKVGSISRRLRNCSARPATRCVTRLNMVRLPQNGRSPVVRGYSTGGFCRAKVRSGSWSGCVPVRNTPRERPPSSLPSTFQRHTKKRFYEDHFAVWHKVIEGREKFCWPRLMEQDVVTLTAEELEWLLDGYDIFRQPHKMLRFKHAA